MKLTLGMLFLSVLSLLFARVQHSTAFPQRATPATTVACAPTEDPVQSVGLLHQTSKSGEGEMSGHEHGSSESPEPEAGALQLLDCGTAIPAFVTMMQGTGTEPNINNAREKAWEDLVARLIAWAGVTCPGCQLDNQCHPGVDMSLGWAMIILDEKLPSGEWKSTAQFEGAYLAGCSACGDGPQPPFQLHAGGGTSLAR
jgi:hypothetical protein